MRSFIYIPFVVSIAVVLMSRLASRRMRPSAAAWSIGATIASVAVCTLGALGLLTAPLLARVPAIARFGQWHPGVVATHTPVPTWLSLLALAVLAVLGLRLARVALVLWRQNRNLTRAHSALSWHGVDELVVTSDSVPRAHALAPTRTRPGRVVLTTAMVELLDDEECHAVIAHERSHLRHWHGAFNSVAAVAVALNPMLWSTRGDLEFALERWADEDAAGVTSRAVTASALARASLAAMQAMKFAPSDFGALSLHSHAVTDRVSALLASDSPRRTWLAWAMVGVAVFAGCALLWAVHDAEEFVDALQGVRSSFPRS